MLGMCEERDRSDYQSNCGTRLPYATTAETRKTMYNAQKRSIIRECMKRKGIELETWKSLALNKTKWRAVTRAPSVYQPKSSSGQYSE
jgi:hypothetical protein